MLKKYSVFLSILLVLICLSADRFVYSETSYPDLGLETLDPEDLRPGMTGYGLTVFQGTEPVRFDVTIKGVLPGYLGTDALIIIEADHPELEDIGAVAGMSGSPIFIDDKMIGALSYGWGFSVRPICGVTPIRKMLEVRELVTEDSAVPPSERVAPLEGWPEARNSLAELRKGSVQVQPISVPRADLAALGVALPEEGGATACFEPLSTPLMVSSTSPAVLGALRRAFKGSLLNPVSAAMSGASGGGSSAATSDAVLQNGSALSVVLVDGDIQLAGLGTATFVDKDRFIAFGHPMFSSGPTDVPAYLGEVVSVVPSLMRPFKIGKSLYPVGAVRQDRHWAIGGTRNRQSKLFPLTIDINAPEVDYNKTSHFQVWPGKSYMPMLVFICLLETADASNRIYGPMTVMLDYTINLSGGKKLKKTEMQAGENMAILFSGFQIMMDLSRLANNRFEPLEIESVSVEMEVEPLTKMMVLDRTFHGPTVLRPGDVFEGEVHFTQWRKEDQVIPIRVPLSKDMKPGVYRIQVIDGMQRTMLERRLRPELGIIRSLDDLIESMSVGYTNNTLSVVLLDPEGDLVLDKNQLPNLPESIANTVERTSRGKNSTRKNGGRILWEEQKEFSSMVMGGSFIMITVTDDPEKGPMPSDKPTMPEFFPGLFSF